MKKGLFIYALLLVVVLGSCSENGEESYILKFYGDAREDIGNSVAIASDGYLIARQKDTLTRDKTGAVIDEYTNKNMMVIKTDWNGNVLWQKSAGGSKDDVGNKIYQLSDGSMICLGTYTDTTSSGRGEDIFIVKLSSAGDILWQKHYGGAGNQTGVDIIETPGGFLIAGNSDAQAVSSADGSGNPSGRENIYMLKISDSGDSLSSYSFGFKGDDVAAAIRNDGKGGYLVLGTTDESIGSMSGNNFFLIRLNGQGNFVEQNIIGTTDDEYASDLLVLSDGYLICGTVGSSSVSQYACLVKISNATGGLFADPVFRQKFQATSGTSTVINSAAVYNDGNYLLGGYVSTISGLRYLVFEVGQDGNPVQGKQIIKGSTGDQAVNSVVAGDDGYIIAVGKNKYSVNSMISFLKFRF